jgi:hypothetical protein
MSVARMAMVARFVFRQFHHTDIGTFLADGEIRSKNHVPPQTCHQTSYPNLVTLRGTSAFSLPGGGVVNDYVPFYFSPITAFSFTINRGNVDVISPSGVNLGKSSAAQRAFFVFSIEKLANAGLYICFSDVALNSLAPIPTVLDDLSKLPTHVAWDLFDESPKGGSIPEIEYTGTCTWFHSRPTPAHHQLRSTKRMAEFLVRDAVPLGLAECIVVENDQVAAQIGAAIAASGSNIPVYDKPWCFCR